MTIRRSIEELLEQYLAAPIAADLAARIATLAVPSPAQCLSIIAEALSAPSSPAPTPPVPAPVAPTPRPPFQPLLHTPTPPTVLAAATPDRNARNSANKALEHAIRREVRGKTPRQDDSARIAAADPARVALLRERFRARIELTDDLQPPPEHTEDAIDLGLGD